MSSSYLPLLFFRRDDDDNDEQQGDDAAQSSSKDNSLDEQNQNSDQDDEEEQGSSSWHTRHASSITMEYSDTDDDDRRHFSVPSSNNSPLTINSSWLSGRIYSAPDDASDKTSRDVSWMKQLAESFRPKDKQSSKTRARKHHRRVSSQREYPQIMSPSTSSILANSKNFFSPSNGSNPQSEASPLLGLSFASNATSMSTFAGATKSKPPLASSSNNNKDDNDETFKKKTKLHPFYTALAASFLQDYEANRKPVLCRDVAKITWHQLQLHHIKYSGWLYSLNLCIATLALFVSSALEEQGNEYTSYDATAGEGSIPKRLWLTGLNAYAICVLAVDLWIRNQLQPTEATPMTSVMPRRITASFANPTKLQRQSSKGQQQRANLPMQQPIKNEQATGDDALVKPLILFLLVLGLETTARLGIAYLALSKADDDGSDAAFDNVTQSHALHGQAQQQQQQQPMVLFSSLLKPLVLFYVSHRARNALEALGRIMRIVIRVLFMELLVIFIFAAIACRLFNEFEAFKNLSRSWLSLFELSTTVVNPSLWMPMYQASKYSAFFFIFFIVTSVLYLHSLVLSVVFQTYVLAASEIHERSVADREEAIHRSYLALRQHDTSQGLISTESVRELLSQLRPHYNVYKIDALVEIVDPHRRSVVDYSTYRTRIRQALNASIRTTRTASAVAMSVELLAVIVAIVNFAYVILVSIAFDMKWFDSMEATLGCIITVVAASELVVRFNPLRISDFTPLTRLNVCFDGLALLAALISTFGMVLHARGEPLAMELILSGRAIDIFRVMRFFSMFRDVVRRSADVLPVLIGPCILVATTLHVFVYVGMALWGGAVNIGQRHELAQLYNLNNFNSYQEGLVTMFNVLVVNDWHAIAEVFLHAKRCSSTYIVMPFFVIGNLMGVSIMLNVVTAFFVQAFVTKLDDDAIVAPINALKLVQPSKAPPDSGLRNSENASFRVSSSTSSIYDQGSDQGADADSEGSSDSDFLEFDVYERQGYDKVMQTVAGGSYTQSNIALDVSEYLGTFEKLVPDREAVGYHICDQLTMERFGNHLFMAMAEGFVESNELHVIVSEMHAELIALADSPPDKNRSLIRTYSHHQRPDQESLEITAALLRKHPALSLLVSRRRLKQA
ncbi:hypothetical protein MPSEU_000407000 [Mayamaea pseudoterrestris]|nr:hypothetical protein MPSEU_000407000 [Mayamaea pseudoterrestris]